MNQETTEAIKAEYQRRNQIVKGFFKEIQRFDIEKAKFFLSVTGTIGHFHIVSDKKSIFSLQGLETYPLFFRNLCNKLHLFFGQNTINIYTNVNYYGYVINERYYLLRVVSRDNHTLLNYLWLFDYKIQGIFSRSVISDKIENLYPFDKSIEILQYLKFQWLLQM